MKSITLEKLIYKNYLKTSLASIIFIEIVLLSVYFLVSNNIINKNMGYILKDVQTHTSSLVNEKIDLINDKLGEMESLIKIVQEEHQNFFNKKINFSINEDIKFSYTTNGMFYKVHNNGGSSVIVSKNTKIDDSLLQELKNSEVFDLTFKTIVEHDKNVVAAYYNSRKNYNRYYPFIENSFDIFTPDLNMENYNFYYLADEKHNPERKSVWTDVYLDPAHKGWLLSIIAPIYKGNTLEGVTGIDISLKKFISGFLNLKLPYDGKSFVMNSNGNLIAMQKELREIFNIESSSIYDYKKDEKIEGTIYKNLEFNIKNFKNEEFVNTINGLIKQNSLQNRVKLNGKQYIIFIEEIKRTNWYVVSFIEEEKVLENVKKLEQEYKTIGYLVVVFIIIFYILFFIFLNKKAKEFVIKIVQPLKNMILITKNIGEKNKIDFEKPSNITELDELNNNFIELITQLDAKTKKLIDDEAQLIYQQKLALTDSLTGCYNRRFLEEFSSEYIKTLKREKYALSLMIIDIDDFKIINDSYGHDIGDKVLVDFSNIVRDCIRVNDLFVRLGGDEFLILLLHTDKESSYMVAQKILTKIKLYEEKYKFTVSIGISDMKEEDNSIDEILKRADNMLYIAKKDGKNKFI